MSNFTYMFFIFVLNFSEIQSRAKNFFLSFYNFFLSFLKKFWALRIFKQLMLLKKLNERKKWQLWSRDQEFMEAITSSREKKSNLLYLMQDPPLMPPFSSKRKKLHNETTHVFFKNLYCLFLFLYIARRLIYIFEF